MTDDAFEQMYETYKHVLYHISNQILKDSYLAEDAVSITFLKVSENFSNISNPVSHKTKRFLIMVCKRVCIDLCRKKMREPYIVSLDSLSEEIEDPKAIILPEEENTLEAAIASLPAETREIILLRYYYDYSAKEISQILNRKESSVYKILERGKQKLKEELEQQKDGKEI